MNTNEDNDEWKIPRGRKSRGNTHLGSGGRNSGGNGGEHQNPQPPSPSYHLSIKVFSRARGQSATAAAAYRAGDRIVDERTGEVHDYRIKQRVEYSEIVAPPWAPEWAYDRDCLWNEAERRERKNGCVAREWQFSIPYGFDQYQAIELAKSFAREIVERHQIAVDFSIHADNPKNLDGSDKALLGYHVHMLGTTRRLNKDGLAEKSRELDDRTPRQEYGGKSQGQMEIFHWRERLAILANHYLERYGFKDRIDHRSYRARGIDKIPQPKLGAALTQKLRAGLGRSDVLSRWQLASEIQLQQAKLNKISNERVAIEAELTKQQADLRKLVNAGLQLRETKQSRPDLIDAPDSREVSIQKATEENTKRTGLPQDKGRTVLEKHIKVIEAARLKAEELFPGDKRKQNTFVSQVAKKLNIKYSQEKAAPVVGSRKPGEEQEK